MGDGMERALEPAVAGDRPATPPESLGQLAEALRNFGRLAVSMHADSDGVPVLDVTGPAGRASVMVGSIHYWWGNGDGPIGSIDQTDLVAERIAARCGGAADKEWPRTESPRRSARPASSRLLGEEPAKRGPSSGARHHDLRCYGCKTTSRRRTLATPSRRPGTATRRSRS
jgi:hypothetical protein